MHGGTGGYTCLLLWDTTWQRMFTIGIITPRRRNILTTGMKNVQMDFQSDHQWSRRKFANLKPNEEFFFYIVLFFKSTN